MTDRPILFSGPMVRALLDGRKTQTRRILKPQLECTSHEAWPDRPDPMPIIDLVGVHCGVCGAGMENARDRRIGVKGIPVRFHEGQRLWVREAWAKASISPIIETIDSPMVIYRAGDNRTDYGGPWKPGIHMPRAASRLTLIVTDVRVERLQDISNADAVAEGSQEPSLVPIVGACWSERQVYANLWNHINGAGAWGLNPWVIAVTFTVEKGNIDASTALAA